MNWELGYEPNPPTQLRSLEALDSASQERKLADWYERRGKRGATHLEAAAAFPTMDVRAVQRCIKNLRDAGYLRYSGNLTRPGPNGKANVVVLWVSNLDRTRGDNRFRALWEEYEYAVKDWERALNQVKICRGRARDTMARIHRRLRRFELEGAL